MIDWSREARLGTMPDEALARIMGVHSSTVRSARYRRGIPAFEARETWWQTAPFGSQTDQQIAWDYRIPVDLVIQARLRRGIAPKPADRAGKTKMFTLLLHVQGLEVGSRIHTRRLGPRLGIRPQTIGLYFRRHARLKPLVERVGMGPLAYWVRR